VGCNHRSSSNVFRRARRKRRPRHVINRMFNARW
jgi:hypothetical protein